MNASFKHFVFSLIVLVSVSMHFRHFSKDLMSIHVWRQTQTQSTIRNFYEEDMNILNPRRNARGDGDGIFRMEFPLMQWLVAVSYIIFGDHLLVTRLFMFIIGLFSVLAMYQLVFNLFNNQKMALIAAWAFNFSPSFYYYTINPIPDNLALCFALWGMSYFFYWYRKKNTGLIISGFLLGLAALCKLPFILYFSVPFIYFSSKIYTDTNKIGLTIKALSLLAWAIFPLCWYMWVIPHWQGNGIVHGGFGSQFDLVTFFNYLQFNFLSTLPELLLNYGAVPFFLAGFYFLFKHQSYNKDPFVLLAVWGAVLLAYFVFEVNMIAKIHDYYLFPFYPLLFILVSYGAYYLLLSKGRFFRHLSVILLLILPITAHLRMADRWSLDRPGFNRDLWTYKQALQEAVPDDALVVVGNDISQYISFYYINKKGWCFYKDELNASKLRSMIEKGATYLYSDSRTIDTNKTILPFLDSLVLEKGSVRVFHLDLIEEFNYD